MKKFECPDCNSRNFRVDINSPGRIVCKNKHHFYWNGEWIRTSFLKKIKHKARELAGLSILPKLQGFSEKPKLYKEARYPSDEEFNAMVLVEKRKARERLKKKNVKKVSLQEPSGRKLMRPYRWGLVWKTAIYKLVTIGRFKIDTNTHFGKLRGRHILVELKKKMNFLGIKTRIDFENFQIMTVDEMSFEKSNEIFNKLHKVKQVIIHE